MIKNLIKDKKEKYQISFVVFYLRIVEFCHFWKMKTTEVSNFSKVKVTN